jgi:flagellar hook-associated protein 1 FlgK
MGGLNTSLLIGTQALEAAQGALTATSNNIANSNTPGYTREIPQFAESEQSQSGNEIIGGGVSLTGLQSVRDELLNLQIQSQTSLQSSVDTQSSSLQQIQTYFSSTGTDIASALSAFSSDLTQLSASPSSSAVQQEVLSSGQNLANAFNNTASGLTSAQSSADTQVTQTVSQINSLTTQIAQLNGQISQLTADGQSGGTVEDQRDELVQQLSQLTGISVMQGSDGETITTGNGTPLVMGDSSYSLQTTTGSDGMQHVLDSNGNDITSSIQGGQLGGAIQIRDQVIPGYLAQLNTLASQFAASLKDSIRTATPARISSAFRLQAPRRA